MSTSTTSRKIRFLSLGLLVWLCYGCEASSGSPSSGSTTDQDGGGTDTQPSTQKNKSDQSGSASNPTSPGTTTPPSATTPPPSVSVGECGDAEETKAFNLANKKRVAEGHPEIACDLQVLSAARAYSKAMCEQRFVGHVDNNGKDAADYLRAAGATFEDFGDVIAAGQDTGTHVVSDWTASGDGDPHHDTIMRPDWAAQEWTRGAIGRADCAGDRLGIYWTGLFVF